MSTTRYPASYQCLYCGSISIFNVLYICNDLLVYLIYLSLCITLQFSRTNLVSLCHDSLHPENHPFSGRRKKPHYSEDTCHASNVSHVKLDMHSLPGCLSSHNDVLGDRCVGSLHMINTESKHSTSTEHHDG